MKPAAAPTALASQLILCESSPMNDQTKPSKGARPLVGRIEAAETAEPAHGAFPRVRMRRNRIDAWTRRLVAENKLSVDDLIWPAFIQDGKSSRKPVPSMPGVDRLSVDILVDAVGEAASLGIPCVALFPYTDAKLKDERGS